MELYLFRTDKGFDKKAIIPCKIVHVCAQIVRRTICAHTFH